MRAKACAPGTSSNSPTAVSAAPVADDFDSDHDNCYRATGSLTPSSSRPPVLHCAPLLKASTARGAHPRPLSTVVRHAVVDALGLSKGRRSRSTRMRCCPRLRDRSLDHDDPIEEVFGISSPAPICGAVEEADLVSPAALAPIEARLNPMPAAGRSTIVRSRGRSGAAGADWAELRR